MFEGSRIAPIVVAGIVALATVAGGYGVRSLTGEAAEPERGPALTALMLENHETLRQLTSRAEVIVVGVVVDTIEKPYANLPFREAVVRVERTVKGSLPAGEIRILQTGGTLQPGPVKGGASAAGRPTELTFEGVPTARPGERYLFFAKRYVGPISSDAYVVLGEVQGKLFVDQQDVIRFGGSPDRLSAREFQTQRAANGRSLSDVLAEVETYLAP